MKKNRQSERKDIHISERVMLMFIPVQIEFVCCTILIFNAFINPLASARS